MPWNLEASYRLPAQVWHAAMDRFFPGGGWLRLERDTRRLALATRDGRGKPEPTRPERLYIDRAIPSIAERLSQAPDRLSEAVLGHGRVSPGRFDERR